MRKHLDSVVINKEAEDMIRSLEKWLLSNGEYKPAPELRYFDQCVSTGLEREISGLRDEVGSQITDAPTFGAVVRPRDPIQGGWLTGENERLLVSARVSQGSSLPQVSDGKTSVPFLPGTAVYCAPNRRAFVSGGVEFVVIQWPMGQSGLKEQ